MDVISKAQYCNANQIKGTYLHLDHFIPTASDITIISKSLTDKSSALHKADKQNTPLAPSRYIFL